MAKRWYSVSVLSNFEKKIAQQIRDSVEEKGMQDDIDEVLVPTEEVIEVRRGKKVSTERRFMPGYVLVHMQMSDEAYHLVNSINRVTGFLGPQGRPMPMRDAEVEQILGRVEENADAPRTLISFDIGEKVKVTDGPVRGLRRARRAGRRGRAAPEGDGVDLRPRDSGRARVHAGDEAGLSRRRSPVRGPTRDPAVPGGPAERCSARPRIRSGAARRPMWEGSGPRRRARTTPTEGPPARRGGR